MVKIIHAPYLHKYKTMTKGLQCSIHTETMKKIARVGSFCSNMKHELAGPKLLTESCE